MSLLCNGFAGMIHAHLQSSTIGNVLSGKKGKTESSWQVKHTAFGYGGLLMSVLPFTDLFVEVECTDTS